MRSLIEKFYSGSPKQRLITVITWLVIISAASTAYSFINLFSQVRVLNEGVAPQSIGFENLPARMGYHQPDETLIRGLEAWKTLAGFAKNLVVEEKGSLARRLTDQIAQHDQEAVAAIRDFNNIDWKHLIIFAGSQIDPLSSSLVESFAKVRAVARFMGLYLRRFKGLHPEEDSSFILAANLKLARLNDLTSPFLIGKMITMAVDGIAMKSLIPLVLEKRINSTEASELIGSLKWSLSVDKPMRAALDCEFFFFRYAYGRLYSNAPLALWILEKIYGNPFDLYQKLSDEMLVNAGLNLDERLNSSHPILSLAFPNFRKAVDVSREKAVHKTILMKMLSDMLGQQMQAVDPVSGTPLKSVQLNGSTVYYSVGRDGQDNQGEGDDIKLPDNLDI